MKSATSKKKIAIVSDAIYPYNKGGKEKRIYDITTRLAAAGYDVTIYCMQWWKGKKTITREGVKLHAISPYHPLYSGTRRSISQAILFSINCFKLITKDFDVVEVDCVPFFQLFSIKLVCLIKGKRMIVSWHEVWGRAYWKEYLGAAGILAYAIERISVALPDVIVSVSDHTTKALRTILKAKKRIVTIPNGMDVQTIINNTPAKRTSDIVFAGRLLSHKNVDVLLEALAILRENNPTVQLFVIGEGPEKKHLQKLARDLDLQNNVSFFNFFEDHNDLYRVMQASRLFVLPSTREGFGIGIIEANACGLPVITIDHEKNAAKELVIHNGNGKLCRLDAEHIAENIEELLTTRKTAAAYRKYAEKHTWENFIADLQKLYA